MALQTTESIKEEINELRNEIEAMREDNRREYRYDSQDFDEIYSAIEYLESL